jgi:hypothetical protein
MTPAIDIITTAVKFPAREVPGLSPSTKNEIYSQAQLPVTANLEAALRYLRHESMVRILWIDAICMDQSNIEERNHQVPLMKTIYSNATTVRVWLGNPTTGSDDAIVILKEIRQGVSLQEIKLQDHLVHGNDLRAIIELLTRPWWERTWVQQELLLAKRAVFHCGFSYFEWSDMPSIEDFNLLMRSAMQSRRFKKAVVIDDLNDNLHAFARIQNMAHIHGWAKTDEHSVHILAHGRPCFNSDDRDSIYGFLGLMSEHIASKFNPNYKMSVADVFQDAAIQITACSQSLILFSLTQYTTMMDRWTPTWVPIWHALKGLEAIEWSHRAPRLTQHEYFSACAGHTMKFEVIGRGLLKLSGGKLDQVQLMGSVTSPPNSTTEEILEQHRKWRRLCLGSFGFDPCYHQERYIAGGSANDAFWRTLINESWSPVGKGERRRRCQNKDHKAYLNWLHELEVSRGYWLSDIADSFHLSFLEACIGRRIFVTKKGYFGIGPAELEEGDEIYILAGGKLPLVLRPLPKSRLRAFELVGDCYVHGIMDGEAVSPHGSGRESVEVSSSKPFYGPQVSDPDLPLRDFHDVFIV